jgi:hypothetical protein
MDALLHKDPISHLFAFSRTASGTAITSFMKSLHDCTLAGKELKLLYCTSNVPLLCRKMLRGETSRSWLDICMMDPSRIEILRSFILSAQVDLQDAAYILRFASDHVMKVICGHTSLPTELLSSYLSLFFACLYEETIYLSTTLTHDKTMGVRRLSYSPRHIVRSLTLCIMHQCFIGQTGCCTLSAFILPGYGYLFVLTWHHFLHSSGA